MFGLELKHCCSALLFIEILYVLKYGSDCQGVVVAACRSFNVHVREGEADSVALGYIEVPLLLQVGRVRQRVLGGVDLPIHWRVIARQRPALTH